MGGRVDNILNPAQFQRLTALKATARALDGVQAELASGRRVRSAVDDPGNFFTARALHSRAHDLNGLLDGIADNIQAIKLAQHGLDAILAVIDQADSFLEDYERRFLDGDIPVTETEDTAPFLSFSSVALLEPYSGAQDSGAPAVLAADGFGFTLDDNVWKKRTGAYTVTADTVVEFDFKSTVIPEIAAIGFETDDTYTNSNTQFFLYGTQTNGIVYSAPIATYQYDGSGEWQHIQIPVGTYFTGTFSALTFIDDDDGGGNDGDASFRNIVIHEGDYVYGQTTPSVADAYEQAYGAILDQIDTLAADSRYRAVALLEGGDMLSVFNETRTSTLETHGIDATAAGLGLDRAGLAAIGDIQDKRDQLDAARAALRSYADSLALDFGVLNARSRFTDSLTAILDEGADTLVNADGNKTAADFLALQTRQIVQTSTLTLAVFSIADFLA